MTWILWLRSWTCVSQAFRILSSYKLPHAMVHSNSTYHACKSGTLFRILLASVWSSWNFVHAFCYLSTSTACFITFQHWCNEELSYEIYMCCPSYRTCKNCLSISTTFRNIQSHLDLSHQFLYDLFELSLTSTKKKWFPVWLCLRHAESSTSL